MSRVELISQTGFMRSVRTSGCIDSNETSGLTFSTREGQFTVIARKFMIIDDVISCPSDFCHVEENMYGAFCCGQRCLPPI